MMKYWSIFLECCYMTFVNQNNDKNQNFQESGIDTEPKSYTRTIFKEKGIADKWIGECKKFNGMISF